MRAPLALAAVAAAAAVSAAAPAITPDPSSTFGVWTGWGVSLAWYANAFGARDDVVAAFFSTGNVTVTLERGATVDLPGLAFSIARYNVGACSDDVVGGQRIALSKNIPAFKQINTYWPAGPGGPVNTSADAGQVAHLLLARSKYNCRTVELFSNSPPWYMTTNSNPSGSNDGTSDNLRASQRAQHAAYMAAVAAHFRDAHGVTPDTVEPFNEVRGEGSCPARPGGAGCAVVCAAPLLGAFFIPSHPPTHHSHPPPHPLPTRAAHRGVVEEHRHAGGLPL